MKYLLTISITFLSFHLHAQQKGATPISDYQDEGIPDLRFADKDAEAFAGFLQSPAGGSLDKDHLKVLLNEKATVAWFAIALDWLMEVATENDKVIIYFSGHGDVERRTLTQPGFLLCWDAPARVYMAGGAFPLSMMQEVITTLSLQNKAKVIMIADACRAGKLSGDKVGGAQLTNSNLAKQYANEIKILSCQPDEFSIEGEQWGGGRGAFSYHLLDGLSGMADRNSDQSVNLMEIRGYLEEHVSEEVAPQNQLPMIVGNGREKLTDVFPEILAQLKEGRKGQMQMFTSTESRGIENDVLAKADSNIVGMYFAFQKSLEDKQFLFSETVRAENDYADFYYKKLSQEPQLERLHSSMRRNYAAALQDDAQQVINNWMKTDIDLASELATGEKVRIPKRVFTAKVRAFPACLERAAELLGHEHYMYATLKARKHFFEGYLLTNSDRNPNKELGEEALAELRKSLEWQSDLPLAYWQMINVFSYKLPQPDSAEFYAQKAIELNPSWVKPYLSLVDIFSGKYKQYDRARHYLEQVSQIDSSSAYVLNAWGLYYKTIKEYDEAEKYLKKSILLDSTNMNPHNILGLVYFNTRQFDKAEKHYLKALEIDSTIYSIYTNLGVLYTNTRQFDKAIKVYKKAIEKDSTNVGLYNNFGRVYWTIRQFPEAEKLFLKAIELDSTYTHPIHNLGSVYYHTGRFKEAKKQLLKAIRIDSNYIDPYNTLGNLYIEMDSTEIAEKYFLKTVQLDSMFWMAYANLGLLSFNSDRWEAAADYTQKAIDIVPHVGGLFSQLGNAYSHIPGRLEDAKKELDKSIEMWPQWADNYMYYAQWFLMKNEPEKAWEYLQMCLERKSTEFKYLQSEPDFEAMRKNPKWNELMKKHFPDQYKTSDE